MTDLIDVLSLFAFTPTHVALSIFALWWNVHNLRLPFPFVGARVEERRP